MLIKLFLLMAALKLHDVNEKPLPAALLFSIPLFVFGLIFGGSFLGLLLGTGLAFVASYAYFWLLSLFPNGVPYFSIMGIGGAILVVVI